MLSVNSNAFLKLIKKYFYFKRQMTVSFSSPVQYSKYGERGKGKCRHIHWLLRVCAVASQHFPKKFIFRTSVLKQDGPNV